METRTTSKQSQDILTLEEIKHHYADEWILIIEPELDEYLNVIRGKVLFHSPDRDETYNQLSLRKGKPVAIEYTGTMPDDVAALI